MNSHDADIINRLDAILDYIDRHFENEELLNATVERISQFINCTPHVKGYCRT